LLGVAVNLPLGDLNRGPDGVVRWWGVPVVAGQLGRDYDDHQGQDKKDLTSKGTATQPPATTPLTIDQTIDQPVIVSKRPNLTKQG
jgi:hypothetical protein